MRKLRIMVYLVMTLFFISAYYTEEKTTQIYRDRVSNVGVFKGMLKSYLHPNWYVMSPHDYYIRFSGDVVVAEVWKAHGYDGGYHWFVWSETSFQKYYEGYERTLKRSINAADDLIVGLFMS